MPLTVDHVYTILSNVSKLYQTCSPLPRIRALLPKRVTAGLTVIGVVDDIGDTSLDGCIMKNWCSDSSSLTFKIE